MFCTKCGFQIKDGYKFCPKCGSPAYVEKKETKSDAKKEDVNDMAKEGNASVDNGTEVKSKEKKTTNAETASKPPKKQHDHTPNNVYEPNPLILEELDIKGVKKKAEQGDKEAMLRQAFRYEMGIGVDKNEEKAKALYNQCGVTVGDSSSWTSDYFFSNILPLNLCVVSKKSSL